MYRTTHAVLWLALLILATGSSLAATQAPITVDFGTTVRTVPTNFYGFHGDAWGGTASRIDTNNDGYGETMSDYQAHRAAMLASKANLLRRDIDLNNMLNPSGKWNYYDYNSGNIDNPKSQVAWAAQNGYKVLFNTYGMARWMANGAASCKSNTKTCEPADYAKWGASLVAFLHEVGCDKYSNVCEIEVWNEPYLGQFWQSDGTCQERIDSYIRMYTETRKAIKAAYPSIPVGGPTGYYRNTCGAQLMDAFLTKVPASNIDFVSIHMYGDSQISTYFTDAVNKIRASGYTKNIKITEYGVSSWTVEVYQPENQTLYLTDLLATALESPQVNTMVLFDWAKGNKYSDGSPNYERWPWRRSMFSEAKLDNTKYPPYYVVQSMATYHSPGSAIADSTGTATVFAVASSKNGQYTLTIGNRDKTAAAPTILLKGLAAAELQDVTTGSKIPVVSGVATLPQLGPYKIKNYRVIPAPTPAPAPPPTTPPPTPAPTDQYLWIEGETASVASPMLSVSSTTAGDGYVWVPPNTGGVGEARYSVTVPVTGQYIMWGRTLAPNEQDNSFLVRVDGNADKTWDVLISPSWQWDKVNDRNVADPAVFTLTAGKHTITVTRREDGTKLDRILLTNDLDYTPSGTGVIVLN